MNESLEHQINRTDIEISHLEDWSLRSLQGKETLYPTMTYEDGVRQTLDWLFGRRDDSPADD